MNSRWVLVTHDYPPLKGGVARYLSDLVAASKGAMRVIVPDELGDSGELVERRRFFGSGLISWWPIVRIMREVGTDSATRVLVSHILPIGTAALLASFCGGPKYTILFHGLDLHLSQRSFWKRWLTKRIVHRAMAVCVNSRFVAAESKRLFPWIEPIVLTPGYAPHALPTKQEARIKLGIGPDEIILLHAGRLVARKGLDRLLEVLPQLPSHVRAVSLGDGPDRERIERLAQPLGSRMTVLGAVDDTLRDAWYAAADLFVFPVRAEGDDLEGYGIVCLEASAAGLPVIVGDQGGAPETVIDGETGFIIDADNRAELTKAIQKLVTDPVLRHQFGERGRARVQAEGDWSKRWEILANL